MRSLFPSFNGTLKSFCRLRETKKKEAKKEMSEDVYSLLSSWTQSNTLSRHTALCFIRSTVTEGNLHKT
jgi:hypothetical protein